jgi:hypothetical protein
MTQYLGSQKRFLCLWPEHNSSFRIKYPNESSFYAIYCKEYYPNSAKCFSNSPVIHILSFFCK